MKGTVLVLLAAILYGIIPSVQNVVMELGVGPVAVTGCCYLISAALSLATAKVQKHSIRIGFKQFAMLMLCGIAGAGMTTWMLNMAYRYIPVGLATMLHFMYPCWVCLAMILLFHEQITPAKLGTLLCVLGGLILLGSSMGKISVLGVVFAAASSVTYCVFVIGNEKSCIVELPNCVKTFWIGLLNAGVFVTWGVYQQTPFPGTASAWGGMVLAAVMVWVAIYALVTGISWIGATKAAFFCIAEPVTSVVVSSLLFSYALGIQEILGSIFMVCAMIFNAIGKSGKR